LLTVAGIGLAPLFKKAALTAGVEPLPLAMATALVAATVALFFIFNADCLKAVRSFDRSTWGRLVAVGALGSGAVPLLAILAMTETTATNRSLFQSMYPVATALAARWMLGEQLAASSYALMAMMCGGLLLMNADGGGLAIGTAFWLLAATLPLIGLADVAAKASLSEADPRAVAAARLLFGAAVLLFVLPWTRAEQWSALLDQSLYVLLAGVSIAAGMLFLYRAMDLTRASVVAALVALAPVATATAEWLVLEQSFSVLQAAGIGLVVAGAIVLSGRS
jgi:drug/metabolite transporter (DMT)-like permease